jgi:hypothetical protein
MAVSIHEEADSVASVTGPRDPTHIAIAGSIGRCFRSFGLRISSANPPPKTSFVLFTSNIYDLSTRAVLFSIFVIRGASRAAKTVFSLYYALPTIHYPAFDPRLRKML